jgi:hypothetical protein
MTCGSVALVLALAAAPAIGLAQTSDGVISPLDSSERVFKYDLSGPRIGATFLPDGDATAQFGWHFESQVSPSSRGPWFIVERVFLIGGTERNAFVPTGTLIFGMRLPSSVEFGLGPSVTVGGERGLNTGIVLAAGQSFRAGGIRIPVNLACAMERGGELRWTLVTGWAIRDPVGRPAAD